MGSEIRDFFDERASKWDEWADDDLERVRHLFGRISVKPGDRVLDCACGTGVVTGLLHEMSQKPVLGIDIAPKMIEIAKRKYEGHESIIFQTCDFLSLEEGEFDLVVIYNAYPHFLDPKALSEQLSERLCSKGRFAIVHSLGRERLAAHHKHMSSPLSRDLLPANEEAKYFEEGFRIIVADEGEDFYLIVGEKR